MASESKRPLIIVPPGLKELFMKEACPEGVSLMAEVREVDPTHPGFDEFEEMIGGEIDEPEGEAAPPQAAPEAPKRNTVLRLVTRDGQRLEP